MNTHMYDHPATQANMALLRARGVRFVEPGEGYLACGWVGKGRLAEPDVIAAEALRIIDPPKVLRGRRIVVTAGPTYEDLDPVRYLGNRSSGRMGIAVATEAARQGADVTLVLGPTSLEPPERRAHGARALGARDARRGRGRARHGRRHRHGGSRRRLHAGRGSRGREGEEAGRTADCLPSNGPWTSWPISAAGVPHGPIRHPVLVGFAAETTGVLEYAARKREAKQVDLIVANDVSQPGAGFEVETNVASFVTAEGVQSCPLEAKAALAARIVAFVAARLGPRRPVSTVGPAVPAGRLQQ